MKLCSGCGVEKPHTAFHRCKANPDGLQYRCIECLIAYRKLRQGRNPDRYRKQIRNANLRSKYGLSDTEYQKMKQHQDGCCGICKKPHHRLVIDHDHETGEVRALLCPSCNTALGKFQDSPEVLQKALDYLKHHHSRRESASLILTLVA